MYEVRNYYTEETLNHFDSLDEAIKYSEEHEDTEVFNGAYCVYANVEIPF